MSDSYLHEGFINDAKGALKRWGGGGSVKLQDATLTENGEYKADKGYNGFGTVTVEVPEEEPALQDKTITENGEYTADAGYDGLGKVTVDVAGSEIMLQDKTVTPSAATQTVTADEGFAGLASVEVAGDSNLSAENIVDGKTIFGVAGKAVADGIKMSAGVTWDEIDSSGRIVKATVYGTEVPEYAFAYQGTALVSVALPENLKKINASAFERAQNLELSSLPNSVTEIKNKAFQMCTSLRLTSLPDQLETLGTSAFGNADIFTNLSIPESVQTIYAYAFGYNNSLQSVTFKGKPRYMQDFIFYDAKNLTVINVPWAEGEVSGAPWGATKATINYNYTGA